MYTYTYTYTYELALGTATDSVKSRRSLPHPGCACSSTQQPQLGVGRHMPGWGCRAELHAQPGWESEANGRRLL